MTSYLVGMSKRKIHPDVYAFSGKDALWLHACHLNRIRREDETRKARRHNQDATTRVYRGK